MSPEQILVSRQGAVCVITLHRPDRLNAWTYQMAREITAAIHAANDDPSVAAIVMTGAGRGFCAGADIGGEFARNLEPAHADAAPDASVSDWVALCRRSKPLIAAINGPAIGVGLTMVLPFDRLIAAESAKLSMRFVKMGLVPELASTHFLVARCGWGAASWLSLSGETVVGSEAGRLGLVDEVVPDGEAFAVALQRAEQLAANPVPQMRMIKELLTRNAAETDLTSVQRREGAALSQAYATPEHREAVTAFLQKRPPDFTAR